jgi:hypothetical protein
MDSAELALLVGSELEVQVMVETELLVMVHCLVILHLLPPWVLLLSCNLAVEGMRNGMA